MDENLIREKRNDHSWLKLFKKGDSFVFEEWDTSMSERESARGIRTNCATFETKEEALEYWENLT